MFTLLTRYVYSQSQYGKKQGQKASGDNSSNSDAFGIYPKVVGSIPI